MELRIVRSLIGIEINKLMKTTIFPFLYFFLLLTVLTACKKDGTGYIPEGSYETYVDPRDGQEYLTVTIGSQVWMAKNMNYKTGNSWWPNNNVSEGNTYGRLYDWSTACSVCPTGWHLPSDAEWQQLVDFIGNNLNAGGKMKDNGTTLGWVFWAYPNTGATNESGFSAQPAGVRHKNGSFHHLRYRGIWWTSREKDHNSAWARNLYYNSTNVGKEIYYKYYGFSVRCMRNN